MFARRALALLACACVLLIPAAAQAEGSVGSYEQIAWVRRAARNFVTAELAGNGAGVCAILNAPLRADQHDRTCAQRWDLRLSRLLHEPGSRARLRAQRHAIATAAVVVHGALASLQLPSALADRPSNSFIWSENCWMLAG
jgi:hypothetical protein